MSEALKALHFDVEVGIDLTKAQMEQAMRKFGDHLDGSTAAVFYYSGHGFQFNGVNYIAAIDTKLTSERDVDYDVVDVTKLLRQMDAQRRVNLIFLDACRDNPFVNSLARSMAGKTRGMPFTRGLAPVDAGAGTLISYSTKDGSVASDGVGVHSPYTTALLEEINTPGLEVGLMLRRVRERVMRATNDQQVPWDYGSLLGEFYFAGPGSTGTRVAPLPPPPPQMASLTPPSRTPSRGDFASSVVFLTSQRGIEADTGAVFGPASDRLTRSLHAAGFDKIDVGAEADGRALASTGELKNSLINHRYVFLVTMSAADNGTNPLNDKIHSYGGVTSMRVYDANRKMFVYDKSTKGNRVNHSPDVGAADAVDAAADALTKDIAANIEKFAP